MALVIKRNGKSEPMNPDKIKAFVDCAIRDDEVVNRVNLMKQILKGMPECIATEKICLPLETCMSKGHATAGRLAIIDLRKNTPNTFREAMCPTHRPRRGES